MPKITHCIFDMDGLLLDTERVYTEVTQEIVRTHGSGNGKEFTWDIKMRCMGRTMQDSTNIIITELQLPLTPEQYIAEKKRLEEEKFPLVKPLPGVEKLLRYLKDHGIPMVVATSSHKENFLLKTSRNQELFQLFDHIICGDDPRVKHGKPAPDIFIEAAKLIGNPAPENCLVFEDSVNGVEAGLAAGMHVCWVPDPNVRSRVDGDSGAVAVYSSLEEFDPEVFELPVFKLENGEIHDEGDVEKVLS
ncbi:HAD-like protein [Basidiobolus meristosporus CBS 931.73]|uniref:HAD-like protein n=1 Tax=Basidiobolus meristosporus CBS 931.73 TaxID=1314790 RepID=A0A1Y1Y515_9FUNG|nr:HAD-like protein [Basidiobolus meristosporus CBS 931.73]|eukprot:ORX92995.1 HAD-like protein [Basidiobolus meristosporus CBS 931.73]